MFRGWCLKQVSSCYAQSGDAGIDTLLSCDLPTAKHLICFRVQARELAWTAYSELSRQCQTFKLWMSSPACEGTRGVTLFSPSHHIHPPWLLLEILPPSLSISLHHLLPIRQNMNVAKRTVERQQHQIYGKSNANISF
jgi:hypothetical protein